MNSFNTYNIMEEFHSLHPGVESVIFICFEPASH